MRIAIITFHFADNYGALLQAYALQKTLVADGHEVVFIDYLPNDHIKVYKPRWPTSLRMLLSAYICIRKNFVFKKFREKFIILSSVKYSSLEELKKNAPSYDVYITGSDQIWNPEVVRINRVDEAYFLNFGDRKINRISYAASFGDEEPAEKYHPALAKSLAGLNSISLREKGGCDFARKLTSSPVSWVIDPTLLINQYDEVVAPRKSKTPYLFVYYYWRNYARVYDDIAEKLGVSLIMCGGCRKWWSDGINGKMVFPTPQEWLSYIRHADFVLATSFHAVTFCLIFKKQFVAIVRKPDGDIDDTHRLVVLLKRLGLGHLVVDDVNSDDILNILRNPIDWSMVDEKILLWREESKHFLTNALMNKFEGEG